MGRTLLFYHQFRKFCIFSRNNKKIGTKMENMEIVGLDEDTDNKNGTLMEVDKNVESNGENENADLRLANAKLISKFLQLEEENDALRQKILKMEAEKNPPAAESPPPIFVPNWLLEVLAWIRRTEMANSSLPTASCTFRQLCWPKLHENVVPRMISSLRITNKKNENGGRAIVKMDGRILQLPSTKPQKYIQGFKKIEIRYLDSDVLLFLENIFPLLDGTESVDVELTRDVINRLENNYSYYTFCLDCPINRLMQILAPKVNEIIDGWHDGFTMTLDLIKLQFPPGIFGQIKKTTYSGDDLDLVLDWLLAAEWSTNVQKRPKLIRLYSSKGEFYTELFTRIKEEFLQSTRQNPFIICLCRNNDAVQQFTPLENEHTGEILTLFECEIHSEGGRVYTHLGRYPKNYEKGDRDRWANLNWGYAPNKIIIDIRRMGTF